ncbi:putative nucleotidyltransferase with HDIG domain [Hydrogenophaga palleronii]|uniref:Nucleotidyltransferase with HDIG domain n=1 Tax=Hydrogenophaga palleronii TaxID=65655 RepID=A0ABU1WQL5_9BURK|nr:HDOD domain-containing protein [Hydrogenophaga palleronii]MDR7151590.1 putative nucleotidyltransferase with HDIG domain [Hydrogenophaga palleronii]
MNAVASTALARQLEPAAWARCIVSLPSLPSAFIAAVELLNNDDASSAACIAAIERDQALTVRVLRLANSPFYGAQGQVSRIGDAVQMLGLRTVASALAAVSLQTALGSLRCKAFCFPSYWRHTLCTAIAARDLAQVASLDASEAFLLGLLHDVGKLILAMTHPDLESQALQLVQSDGIAMHEAEQQLFGVTHAEVGAVVAKQWNFPASFAEAIADHHRPEPAPAGHSPDFPLLIYLANQMAHGLETPPELEARLKHPLWSSLGTSDQQLQALAEQVGTELQIMSCA